MCACTQAATFLLYLTFANMGHVPARMSLCPLGCAAPVPMRRGKRGSVELNWASGTVGMQGHFPNCHCVCLLACAPSLTNCSACLIACLLARLADMT